jgi:ribonuclease E
MERRAPREMAPQRGDRGPQGRPAPRPTSSEEPWSEVPPELEAVLRAQLAGRGGRPAPAGEERAPERRAAERRPSRETVAEPVAGSAAPTVEPEAAAPKRRTTRKVVSAGAPETPAREAVSAGEPSEAAAPKRRTTRKAAAETPVTATTAEVVEVAAPKRRTTRKGAPAAEPVTGGEPSPEAAAEPSTAPKRRTTRRKAETTA